MEAEISWVTAVYKGDFFPLSSSLNKMIFPITESLGPFLLWFHHLSLSYIIAPLREEREAERSPTEWTSEYRQHGCGFTALSPTASRREFIES